MVPCPWAGTSVAPDRAPITASVIRLEPSTLPAATALGGRAFTTLPSGAMMVTGANAPADAGMSGSIATRTAKYTADRVTAMGQLRFPGPVGSLPVKSTVIASPLMVTATRITMSSSVTPSPSRHSRPVQRPSGSAEIAARVRRCA